MGLQMAALPTAANLVAVSLLVLLIWTPVVINAVREYKNISIPFNKILFQKKNIDLNIEQKKKPNETLLSKLSI